MWSALVGSVAWATSCASPSLFAEADQATWVAVIDFESMLEGRVVEVWKGDEPVPLALRPIPDPPVYSGRALVFLGPDASVHSCDLVLKLHVDQDRRLAGAVKQVLALHGPTDRAAKLVAWSVGDDEALAAEALRWLASRPDLLAAVDAEQQAALVGAVPRATGRRTAPLSWTLARLQVVSSVPAWLSWLATPDGSAGEVVAALQLTTHHRAVDHTPGESLHGEKLAAVRGDFEAWWAAWGGRPPAEGWAASNADAPLAAAIARNRCELDAAMPRSAMPTSYSVSAEPRCP
jgi:hypothetical protein